MEAITTIATALALGAASGFQSVAEKAVKDSYEALKTSIQRRYKNLNIQPLEKNPNSEARRKVLIEDLSEVKADQNQDILQKSQILIDHIQTLSEAELPKIGVKLEDIKALNLNIQLGNTIIKHHYYIPRNSFLKSIWEQLDSSLQDALALAALQAKRKGKNHISTNNLFATLRRLNPEPLSNFFKKLPTDALPEPISEDISVDDKIFGKVYSLSPCITTSLTKLSSHIISQKKITSQEVFVDLAKYCRGNAVKRLRTCGVNPKKIDSIVKQLGWSTK
ncbi:MULTISPECIES: hypothetical protein [Crocosphaera]|uniref:Uncharacterized protein n=5 Tax=Crocosphaera watsonii TaxID=263511 RepID=T2JYU0_CROWT|nr:MULTISPECIES: hypothetical protein [Crocosphaera]MCH2245208.1 hypothetical protein [Crocosphaera sp.]CCQ57934.1 hypothetical protein CWATWH0005_3388 [Crocosphaera watsonii WH 0005]CCQ70928.1 hypothetical protein CWATWH0402_3287 [Crocosphaera watsonii WH 0402]